jgi:hypothetical protein
MGSAEGEVQHLHYVATFPLLLNISDQPPYSCHEDAAGLVKMYAMVNVQQYQMVAVGETVAACEANYVRMLTDGRVVDRGRTDAGEITGTVAEIRSAVAGGNSVYYIRLEDGESYYVLSAADNPLAVILDVETGGDDPRRSRRGRAHQRLQRGAGGKKQKRTGLGARSFLFHPRRRQGLQGGKVGCPSWCCGG